MMERGAKLAGKDGGRLSTVMQDRIAATRQDEKGLPTAQGPKDRYGFRIEGDGRHKNPRD